MQPCDFEKVSKAAELLVIDEAAAIPITIVKNLIGPYLVFMSSTVNGYEGTGRSLSLKLIQQLKEGNRIRQGDNLGGRMLKEVQLDEPIRYGLGDPIESWLSKLLCLNSTTEIDDLKFGSPH